MIFNAVGLAGLAVQLAVVALLVRVFDVHYLIATAVGCRVGGSPQFHVASAVDLARSAGALRRAVAARLVHFHLLNGVVSLAGNVG